MLHVREDPVDDGEVGDLEDEAHLHDIVLVRRGRARDDVHTRIGEEHDDVLQQAQPVDGLDVDLNLVDRLNLSLPGDFDDALGIASQIIGIGTIGPVH